MVVKVGSQIPFQLGILTFCPASKIKRLCLQNAGVLWGRAFQGGSDGEICTYGTLERRTEVVVEPSASEPYKWNISLQSHKIFLWCFWVGHIHWGSCSFTSVLFVVQEASGWTSPWLRMTSNQVLTWSVRKSSPME